jgi:hypothetical protein
MVISGVFGSFFRKGLLPAREALQKIRKMQKSIVLVIVITHLIRDFIF